MTDRLYYNDSYLQWFEAEIEEAADDGRRLYLNRTAFYPTSGGQPHDLGEINGITVVEVIDEEERVAHLLSSPVTPGKVQGTINWARRIDFMRQHSGQHLLSAVFETELGARTASVHFGDESVTVDLEIPALAAQDLQRVERQANLIVMENRQVLVAYEDAENAEGLRKASSRQGLLRVVSIAGLDKSACGGTHVRSTGEVGPILLRRLDKIRGNVRVEFLCGPRAIDRARKDYEELSSIAKQFSCSLEDAGSSVAAILDRAKSIDKQVRTLSTKLAETEARCLHAATLAQENGIKVISRIVDAAASEETRSIAQAFAACGKAVFQLYSTNPPSAMLACSADSGHHAGNLLKNAFALAGGKGGGSATFGQGSLPSKDAIAIVKVELAKHGL